MRGELVAATSPPSIPGTSPGIPSAPIEGILPYPFTQPITYQLGTLRSGNAKQVYLAGPIGAGGSEHNGPWRGEATAYLGSKGIIVVEPLEASRYHLYGVDESDPTVKKILTQRDKRFSMESDFLLVNFLGSTARSIGCSMELGWADAADTTIVTVMDADDEHRHPMVESVSDYIVEKLSEGCEIISSLAADRVEDM